MRASRVVLLGLMLVTAGGGVGGVGAADTATWLDPDPLCEAAEAAFNDPCIEATVVFEPDGIPIEGEECEITVKRLHAHAYGVQVWTGGLSLVDAAPPHWETGGGVGHYGALYSGEAIVAPGDTAKGHAWVDNGQHPEYAFYVGASAHDSFECPDEAVDDLDALFADSLLSLDLNYALEDSDDGPICVPELHAASVIATSDAGEDTNWALQLESQDDVIESYSGTLTGTSTARLPTSFDTVLLPGETLYYSAWVEDPVWRYQNPSASAVDYTGFSVDGPSTPLPDDASVRWGAIHCVA